MPPTSSTPREPIVLHEECAPRRVLELFSVKWTTMVLHALHQHGEPCRTGTLARSLPGCSKKMLTQTLREMERDGLIDRKVYPVVPPRVEYTLTPLGSRFVEPLEMLYAWASANEDALQTLRSRKKKVSPLPETVPVPVAGSNLDNISQKSRINPK